MCAAKLTQPHLVALNCHSVHAQNTFSVMHEAADSVLRHPCANAVFRACSALCARSRSPCDMSVQMKNDCYVGPEPDPQLWPCSWGPQGQQLQSG